MFAKDKHHTATLRDEAGGSPLGPNLKNLKEGPIAILHGPVVAPWFFSGLKLVSLYFSLPSSYDHMNTGYGMQVFIANVTLKEFSILLFLSFSARQ